jgi:hypothetical protein
VNFSYPARILIQFLVFIGINNCLREWPQVVTKGLCGKRLGSVDILFKPVNSDISTHAEQGIPAAFVIKEFACAFIKYGVEIVVHFLM